MNFNEADKMFSDIKSISKTLQLELLKGNIKWEDDEIQFFIPSVLIFTDFDWLELIAEYNLVEEDEIVVKNYLAMVKSLIDINGDRLSEEVAKKIGGMLR
ncbi:MAG: hypothetical protein IJF83_10800 [Methanobrevibacter sp.]|nr:hypothetical protein [Methanobrevibacter sp.]